MFKRGDQGEVKMKTYDINKPVVFSSDKPVKRHFRNAKGFHAALICLEKGTEISPHPENYAVLLTVLKGKGIFTDINEETSNEIIEMILEDPVGMGITPISGAVEVLTRLSYFGPIFFVTARSNRDAIIEWVEKTLGLGDGNAIHLEATGAHEDKLPILLKHGIRYFVEDRLETCYLIQGSPVTPIVFDQPWNRKEHPFLSVGDWDEIHDMIEWQI